MSRSRTKPTPKVAAAGSRLSRWRSSLRTLSRGHKVVVTAVCLLIIAVVGYWAVYPLCLGFHHADKGRRALDEQDYPLARSHWSRCVEVWPTSAEAHFSLARSGRGDGNLVSAGQHLKKAENLGWPADAIEFERLLLRQPIGVHGATGVPPEMLEFACFDNNNNEMKVLPCDDEDRVRRR